jgi:phosphopantothenoylcysteine decarboxylase/phosphopantothenate--cysteine ligase
MRVALGVSGGIAAYKSAELLRLLQERGLEVQVIMTRAAREFVTPLTFAALSGRKVITEMFGGEGAGEPNVESAIEHIAVAQSIDVLVIAPATADTLAKLAHGLADDFLTTLVLATTAPIIVAPAMNVNMWENAATEHNIAMLRSRGIRVVEPDAGYLACGMTGAGRLASIEAIRDVVLDALQLKQDLQSETVLVTAGPTEEPLDAIRFITNRSSGKMGYALAEAGLRRGARVILVSGPTHLGCPESVEVERVRTANEMGDAVIARLGQATLVVMAAAVADFRPSEVHSGKLKKRNGVPELHLEKTRDILSEVAARRGVDQIVVGFAAETDRVIENAGEKLHQKRLDLVVANDVSQQGAGFDVETNIVTLLFADGRRIELAKMSKFDVANRIFDEAVELRKRRPIMAGHAPGFAHGR